jgi:hypothetical protein
MREFKLEGKDWFTEPEAAVYCCVGLSTFREGYRALGIKPRRFLGKKLYSRLELNDAIRNSEGWDRESVVRAPVLALSTSENLMPVRLRPYKPRKGRGISE